MSNNAKPDSGCAVDGFVRLWLVIEEDRGMGATIRDGYATVDEAISAANGGHEYIESVDIPWSRLESLNPNTTLSVNGVDK